VTPCSLHDRYQDLYDQDEEAIRLCSQWDEKCGYSEPRESEKSNSLHKLPPSSSCHFSSHDGKQKCWYPPSRLHSVITQHTPITTLQYNESESIIKMKIYNGQNLILVVIKTTKIFWGVKYSIVQHFLYVGHFRRFVYDILALTKYNITSQLVVLSISTNVLYKM